MFVAAGKFFARIALGFVALVASHAILLVCHNLDWYPEEQLARMIMGSPTALENDLVQIALTFLLAIIPWWTLHHFFYRRASRPQMGVSVSTLTKLATPQLVFPNECNAAEVQSLFKRSRSPLPDGHPHDGFLSVHNFYVGVQNPTPDRTLKNARVVVENMSIWNLGQILNLPLLCERTGAQTVDIPPGCMEYFLLGEGVDESDVGMSQPWLMSKSAYKKLISKLRGISAPGFTLKGLTAGRPIF